MKKFTKRIPLLLLVVTIITIALQVFDLPLWTRILLAVVAIVTTVIAYLEQQKSDRHIQQRFRQVQEDTEPSANARYRSIFAPYQRAQQQPPPKGKGK